MQAWQHTQCTWCTLRTCTVQYTHDTLSLYAPAPCCNTGSIVIPWYRLVTQLRNRCALKQTTTGGLLILDHGPTDFRVCSAARTINVCSEKISPVKPVKEIPALYVSVWFSWYFSLIWFWKLDDFRFCFFSYRTVRTHYWEAASVSPKIVVKLRKKCASRLASVTLGGWIEKYVLQVIK